MNDCYQYDAIKNVYRGGIVWEDIPSIPEVTLLMYPSTSQFWQLNDFVFDLFGGLGRITSNYTSRPIINPPKLHLLRSQRDTLDKLVVRLPRPCKQVDVFPYTFSAFLLGKVLVLPPSQHGMNWRNTRISKSPRIPIQAQPHKEPCWVSISPHQWICTVNFRRKDWQKSTNINKNHELFFQSTEFPINTSCLATHSY